MRQLQKGKGDKKPRKKAEPLAEGIRKRRPHGFFTRMSDDELVDYACSIVEKKGLKSRIELQGTDSGLHAVLRKRKLLDRVGLEKQRRDWASVDDENLVSFVRDFIAREGITNRKKLEKVELRLYTALRRRDLLDAIGLEKQNRDWASMSDDEIVGYAKRFVKKENISGRKRLVEADYGLYQALMRRNLLDRIGLVKKGRNWASMSDDEIVEYARRVIEEKGLEGRSGLRKADGGLYGALKRRKLVDAVGLESAHKDRKVPRKWVSMSDKELITYAQNTMMEKGIFGRKELEIADLGLYYALTRRKLLDRVGFEEKQRPKRDWKSMGDDQILDYAQRYLDKKGVSRRSELMNVDSGLYSALHRRKLIDRVFSSIESDQKTRAVQDVVDAMKEFS